MLEGFVLHRVDMICSKTYDSAKTIVAILSLVSVTAEKATQTSTSIGYHLQQKPEDQHSLGTAPQPVSSCLVLL